TRWLAAPAARRGAAGGDGHPWGSASPPGHGSGRGAEATEAAGAGAHGPGGRPPAPASLPGRIHPRHSGGGHPPGLDVAPGWIRTRALYGARPADASACPPRPPAPGWVTPTRTPWRARRAPASPCQ